jgi:hypothetical protein
MNIKNYWNIKKDKLRIIYPHLTDKDLKYSLGEEKKMIETLGSKLGITQQELLHMIVTI